MDRFEGVLPPRAEERDQMLVRAQSQRGGRHASRLLAEVAGVARVRVRRSVGRMRFMSG
jgi:hypothetical protein